MVARDAFLPMPRPKCDVSDVQVGVSHGGVDFQRANVQHSGFRVPAELPCKRGNCEKSDPLNHTPTGLRYGGERERGCRVVAMCLHIFSRASSPTIFLGS